MHICILNFYLFRLFEVELLTVWPTRFKDWACIFSGVARSVSCVCLAGKMAVCVCSKSREDGWDDFDQHEDYV